MVRAILTSSVIKTALFLSIGFWFMEWALPGNVMAVWLSSTIVFISITVCFLYAPVVLTAIANSKIDRVAQLCMGVVLSWAMIGVMRGYNFAFHMSGGQSPVFTNDLIDYFSFLLMCGGVLHVTAPDSHMRVPLRSWMLLFVCVVAGSLATAYAYTDHFRHVFGLELGP